MEADTGVGYGGSRRANRGTRAHRLGHVSGGPPPSRSVRPLELAVLMLLWQTPAQTAGYAPTAARRTWRLARDGLRPSARTAPDMRAKGG